MQQLYIDNHTKEKCWNLHPELNLKNKMKDVKKKNLMAIGTGLIFSKLFH